MKSIKIVLTGILSLVILTCLSQCSSTHKLQKKEPITVGEVYFQKWAAGIKEGGSGLNIFIPIEEFEVTLDSVYFKGKGTKLEVSKAKKLLYIGKFLNSIKQKEDIIMSNEPNAEYGNEIPKKPIKIPFELKDNECIISYKQDSNTKYFKIYNVIEKNIIPFPNAPTN